MDAYLDANGQSGSDARQIVTFAVDGRVFGIDVGLIREIKGWQATTPLPNAPSYVRGVINLRGVILAVFDLRARFGAGLTQTTPKHVILVVNVGERMAGLLVDAVSDIVDVAASDIHPPPVVSTDGLDQIEGVALLSGAVVALLNLPAVLSELAENPSSPAQAADGRPTGTHACAPFSPVSTGSP